MSPSKIGLHVHQAQSPTGLDRQATIDAVRSAPWAAVKQFNGTDLLAVAKEQGIALRVLRVWDDAGGLSPKQLADRVSTYDLRPVTHVQAVCETAQGYDLAWQEQFLGELWHRGFGGHIAAFGFATGNPTQVSYPAGHTGPHFPQWLALVPLFALLLSRSPDGEEGLIGLDEYWGRKASDPQWTTDLLWYARRHEQIEACLSQHGITTPRYIRLETGRDQVPVSLPYGGWQALGWTAAEYLDCRTQLDAADRCCAKLAASVDFSLNATPDWVERGFEVAPLVASMASYVRAVAAGERRGAMLSGIDVSNNQGAVQWPLALGGLDFVLVKASEGVGFADAQFSSNWSALRRVPSRGAYHFARPDRNSPEEEASYFLSVVPPLLRGDLLALDLEVGDQVGDWARRWFRTVDRWLGKPCPLYTNLDYIRNHGLSMAVVGRRPLWLAEPSVADYPDPPLDWDNVAIWQSGAKAVDGIAGLVDTNLSTLTIGDLDAMGYAPSPPPEDEAYAYYVQRGITLDRTHAIWTVALLPLYLFWKGLDDAGSPLADLVKPGPLTFGEFGMTWGSGVSARPASCVHLTNRSIAVYQSQDGVWHPFQVEF